MSNIFDRLKWKWTDLAEYRMIKCANLSSIFHYVAEFVSLLLMFSDSSHFNGNGNGKNFGIFSEVKNYQSSNVKICLQWIKNVCDARANVKTKSVRKTFLFFRIISNEKLKNFVPKRWTIDLNRLFSLFFFIRRIMANCLGFIFCVSFSFLIRFLRGNFLGIPYSSVDLRNQQSK